MKRLFLPSYKNLLLLIVFVFFVWQKIYDADIWWHLKAGELIWQTHTIPRFDLFSYTNFGQVWVAHEWLSELIFYVIYMLGGWPGLVIWQSLMVTAILYVLEKIMALRGVRTPYRLLGILLAVGGTIAFWLTRPHLWTWLFLVVLVWLLENKKSLWLIPLLFLAWVNLHTGYVVGLAVLGIYITCYLKEYGEDYGAGAVNLANKAQRRWLIAIGYLTLAVCLLNPNGFQIFLFPLTFATGQLPNYKYVQEWGPPTIKLVPVFFALIIGFVLLKPHKTIDKVILVLFLLLSLTAVRHVPLFILLTMPCFCLLVQTVMADKFSVISTKLSVISTAGRDLKISRFARNDKLVKNSVLNLQLFNLDTMVSGGVTVIALMVLVSYFLWSGRIPVRVAPENFPVKAVEFIQTHELQGNLFHHYNWGGYLIWKLWPAQKVFIDGRNEVHGLRFLEDEYLELINLGPKWQSILEKYQIRYVLLPSKVPLVQMLIAQSDWQIVFKENTNVLLGHSELTR